MTPEQQSALEGVVGRVLTGAEITAIDPLLNPENRNDVAIVEILSSGRVRVEPREIGIGTILMVLAPNGGQFLDFLASMPDRNVHWSLELIRQGRFDIGLAGTRAMMQEMAAGPGLETVAPAFAALLALAEVPDPVQLVDVSHALNVAEGRLVF